MKGNVSKSNYSAGSLMSKFTPICTILEQTTAPVESLDKPIKDWVQEAWLACLEQLRKNGVDVQSASTVEELIEIFTPHAALIVGCYYQAIAQSHRELKGNKNSPNKQRILKETINIDGYDPEGYPWSEIIEDGEGEIPFRHAEELDMVFNDPRLSNLNEKEREAINRFAVAFFLHEAGYKLPNKVSASLKRDRKLTGFPLHIGVGRR